MKKFLAIFTGSPASLESSGWLAMDETQRKQRETAGKAAWGEWVKKYEASIVYSGSPLGKTKKISKPGIEDIKNNMAAYVVVQAETHEAAALMFENHPHFTIFPGDAVELMECLPIPGM